MSSGSPASHIPSDIGHVSIAALFEFIGLPRPSDISKARVTVEYHAIYLVSFSDPNSENLVLRVPGPHLPKIKTENEAAIMAWISTNTSIPIPRVIRVNDIYADLDAAQINVLVELHEHEWPGIGGLTFNDAGNIELGPVLEETFWQVPDITNGPFETYVEYISAHVRKCIYMITVHEKLAFMREHITRLEAFIGALNENARELNRVKLRLAHKDLHFANILYDPGKGAITCILNWEFSGIVPFIRWNPSRAFLWNALQNKRHIIPEDAAYSSPKQEAMQEATTYLRAITEVVPRGQKAELVEGWKNEVLRRISVFGV